MPWVRSWMPGARNLAVAKDDLSSSGIIQAVTFTRAAQGERGYLDQIGTRSGVIHQAAQPYP